MHSGDLLRSPLCITITLFYFSSRPLYLSIWRLSASIERSTASSKLFAPALGHQVVSRNMEVDRGDFISEFVVFIQFQYDVGSDSPFDKTVEFVHFVLYEFDQLPVGVEFYGLNLYVHNTMFYKVRYLRNCAPADQFCCFVCSAPFFSRG